MLAQDGPRAAPHTPPALPHRGDPGALCSSRSPPHHLTAADGVTVLGMLTAQGKSCRNLALFENISRKIFVENRLDTMMHVIYGNNATQAVKSAFRHLF